MLYFCVVCIGFVMLFFVVAAVCVGLMLLLDRFVTKKHVCMYMCVSVCLCVCAGRYRIDIGDVASGRLRRYTTHTHTHTHIHIDTHTHTHTILLPALISSCISLYIFTHRQHNTTGIDISDCHCARSQSCAGFCISFTSVLSFLSFTHTHTHTHTHYSTTHKQPPYLSPCSPSASQHITTQTGIDISDCVIVPGLSHALAFAFLLLLSSFLSLSLTHTHSSSIHKQSPYLCLCLSLCLTTQHNRH